MSDTFTDVDSHNLRLCAFAKCNDPRKVYRETSRLLASGTDPSLCLCERCAMGNRCGWAVSSVPFFKEPQLACQYTQQLGGRDFTAERVRKGKWMNFVCLVIVKCLCGMSLALARFLVESVQDMITWWRWARGLPNTDPNEWQWGDGRGMQILA